MKPARRIIEPSALELVEESVHLVRRAPAATLLIYYAGAVPFVLGLLFFWAHATWFQPSSEQLAWNALGLIALFVALKLAQAEFCARLMADRLGAEPPVFSWRRAGRIALGQWRLQPWALVAVMLAALFTVPFGWVYAYAQNLVVLGDEEQLHDEAVAQAKLWPAQNHVGLLVIFVLSFGVWVNLAAAFVAVPWLANKLLGIENVFGLSGWWFFNTTFVASVTALTWLAVDPLLKAFYTLRIFHGRARRTGEDVRVDLHLARGNGAVWRSAVAMVVLFLALPRVTLRAAEPATAAPRVETAQLDRAIDGVLAGSDFRWRLRPVGAKEAKSNDGPLKRFVRQGFDMVSEMARAIGRGFRAVADWFDRHFMRDGAGAEKKDAGAGAAIATLRMLLYVFIAAAVVLIGWVIWLMVRSARRNATPVVAARAVAAAAPDLHDEAVQAAQLPVDGWLALAREQAGRGEWRLACRALYLATLARLAGEGLVSLAKFKTNLDYEREVRRRALSRVEVATRFAARRREFEAVWYGRTEPGEADVRTWLAELERPAS